MSKRALLRGFTIAATSAAILLHSGDCQAHTKEIGAHIVPLIAYIKAEDIIDSKKAPRSDELTAAIYGLASGALTRVGKEIILHPIETIK